MPYGLFLIGRDGPTCGPEVYLRSSALTEKQDGCSEEFRAGDFSAHYVNSGPGLSK